ncbi:hypothetical protein KUTeg_011342 [Tegillarca granosa]|uniref:Uncharacterized protein n=1 Tax=Tegillarca granosa TaxID=220873 RepID=A0ABQ9F140_TEGGR|nr:hypothetical protein KUTeg_011342 [Tegillarca granosa]
MIDNFVIFTSNSKSLTQAPQQHNHNNSDISYTEPDEEKFTDLNETANKFTKGRTGDTTEIESFDTHL